mmetsp:Transcript_76709/g.177942  ORF Transcript_76709/g.177942 Transcript_76709/m.177942 type:complete len:102 (+) Transcript_76709:391-696(+)
MRPRHAGSSAKQLSLTKELQFLVWQQKKKACSARSTTPWRRERYFCSQHANTGEQATEEVPSDDNTDTESDTEESVHLMSRTCATRRPVFEHWTHLSKEMR